MAKEGEIKKGEGNVKMEEEEGEEGEKEEEKDFSWFSWQCLRDRTMCPIPHKVWGPQEPTHCTGSMLVPWSPQTWSVPGSCIWIKKSPGSDWKSQQTSNRDCLPQDGASLWPLVPSHSFFNLSHEDTLGKSGLTHFPQRPGWGRRELEREKWP